VWQLRYDTRPYTLACLPGDFLIPRLACAPECAMPVGIRLTLPAGQQISANPQLSGNLGAADTRLPGLFNRTSLELGAVLSSLRHDHSFCPLWGLFEVSVKSG